MRTASKSAAGPGGVQCRDREPGNSDAPLFVCLVWNSLFGVPAPECIHPCVSNRALSATPKCLPLDGHRYACGGWAPPLKRNPPSLKLLSNLQLLFIHSLACVHGARRAVWLLRLRDGLRDVSVLVPSARGEQLPRGHPPHDAGRLRDGAWPRARGAPLLSCGAPLPLLTCYPPKPCRVDLRPQTLSPSCYGNVSGG